MITSQNVVLKEQFKDLFYQPIFGHCSHFIPPENTRKPLVS